MGRLINETGNTYGVLKVIGRHGTKEYKDGTKRSTWSCKCECGNLCVVNGIDLRRGDTTSCGCKKEGVLASGNNNRKHGFYGSKEYNTWNKIKERCKDVNNPNYGGRGIIICDEWLESFETFLSDVGFAPSKDHSIDRIDVNGNYCKENCRWVTNSEQAKNKRLSPRNTSGKTGVSFDTSSGKWVASINVEGKQKTLGRFVEFEEAVLTRKEAELKYYGKYTEH